MNCYGLIGKKLGHSISPSIHEEIFKLFNISGEYKLYELAPEKLYDEINEFKIKGIKGFNVTIPYKFDIMPLLDHISEEAAAIGAVNTVNFKDNKLYGYNTDYYGIKLTFEKHNIDLKGKPAVILGNGGAAAAVVQYLIDAGCSSITFVVRNIEKAKSNNKFSQFSMVTYDQLPLIKDKYVLINCTPCGMFPKADDCAVSKDFVNGFSFAFDLIYNPKQTLFLQYASKLGIKHSNGLYMLVGQAVAAESIWNGINFDLATVDDIYKIIDEKVI
ncbi:shikimate dehydrogenase [Clostridium oryzae]|uniref:Shikimate dehydrogenase (NADP(+)) n=1 Tax=Clostridium oryzae TaxID=1450648 RepID=A0A1V4ICN6_9CLOT|nr:shikimate dehydrogenase [Clostridium oryzae]OPJ57395.1 shikimate dehydrogenase [Clostridium oryzae]